MRLIVSSADARTFTAIARVTLHGVRRPLDLAIATVREWKRRRQGRLDLRALRPYELRDLGLSAADVATEIDKPSGATGRSDTTLQPHTGNTT